MLIAVAAQPEGERVAGISFESLACIEQLLRRPAPNTYIEIYVSSNTIICGCLTTGISTADGGTEVSMPANDKDRVTEARGPQKRKPSPAPSRSRVGQRLGQYRLCLEIGRGGMATVYLARVAGRSGMHRFVALKCIRPEYAEDEKFLEMFLDEAQLAAQIHHANVCSVLDFDQQDGVFYLAMEYLSGRTLTAVQRQLQKQPPADLLRHSGWVARILESACEGLHAAHELRNVRGELMDVVHRDVSPENVFITHDGNVKIVDFGIAYASEQHHETGTGIVKGKCSYLSPEVLAGQTPDRRADIWGLGVVAWELLTQRKLFDQPNGVATLRAISEMELPKPSAVRPGIPARLDEIVMRAIERDRSRRYETARELGRQLNRFLVESQLIVGLAEVAEQMHALFPEAQACTRQLLNVAEQMDEVSDGTSTYAVIDTDIEGSESVEISVVRAPAPQPAASVLSRPWRWARPTPAVAVALSVVLAACSAAVGWRLHGAPGAADASPPARTAAAVAASARPAPASAMAATPGPAPGEPAGAPVAETASAPGAEPTSVPAGFAVEAQPVGADASGAVLLRLQIVPRAGQLATPRARRSPAVPASLAPAARPAGASNVRSEARAAEKIAPKGG
jgi:serine/threonine-protein kinase